MRPSTLFSWPNRPILFTRDRARRAAQDKPKACNYGLIHARGEYLVIYDAEDLPDPDQLKRVIVAFQKTPADVVCIQAKLNYYNRKQNC